MGRPIFTFELADPDFSWLISNFKENNPQYSALESSSLPVVFISSEAGAQQAPAESEAEFNEPEGGDTEQESPVSERKAS